MQFFGALTMQQTVPARILENPDRMIQITDSKYGTFDLPPGATRWDAFQHLKTLLDPRITEDGVVLFFCAEPAHFPHVKQED